jgi:type II secretory pathway pseudopilin PulG
MDSSKLNDWLQVVGLFGVVASLLFVGMQMKQDRDIAISAAYQARSSQITEIQTAMAGDSTMRAFTIKANAGQWDTVSADEAQAANFYLAALFNLYENIHYQYQNGFIDDEHWQRSRSGMKSLLSAEFPRSTFRNELSGWRQSFRELGEELISEVDAEAAGQ